MEKSGLRHLEIENINEVFSTYSQIEKVVIYGSRVNGNYIPASDIDLTLFGDKLT